jgi:hypothetical protein
MTGTTARGLRLMAATCALLLAACGGDSGPTGPGGGGNGGGNSGGGGDGGSGQGDQGIAGAYELVNLGGRVALPIDLTIETCDPVRFYGGGLRLNRDGTWQLEVEIQGVDGPQDLEDEGSFEQDGTTLWFESEYYGDSFEGEIDGTVAKLDYDYCPDGQSDIQFWFQK